MIKGMGMESTIKHNADVLTGFNGFTLIAIGMIVLDILTPLIVSSQTFMIVMDPALHNGILGQPWLVKIRTMTFICGRHDPKPFIHSFVVEEIDEYGFKFA